MRQDASFPATAGLAAVRWLPRMKWVQMCPAVGLTSLCPDIWALAAEITHARVCVRPNRAGSQLSFPAVLGNDPEFLCSPHTSISSKSWEPSNEPSRSRRQN